MIAPCKDCADRKVGCHNKGVCEKWDAYQVANKEAWEKKKKDQVTKSYECSRNIAISSSKKRNYYKHH